MRITSIKEAALTIQQKKARTSKIALKNGHGREKQNVWSPCS
jgi:hypothetical protein